MDFTRTSHGGSLLRVLLLFLPLPPAVGSLFAKDLPDPQANEYSRRIWRTQDGLPESRIQALAQTPDGYLWIGTGGGLVRFDGIQFTVFDRSNTPAFRDDNIQVLRSAKDGSLWIGSGIGTLLH